MVTVTDERGADKPAVFWGLLTRGFIVLLGGSAIAWGVASFPVFWEQQPIERTAAAIVDRDTFKPGALDALIPAVVKIENTSYCRPEARRSAAIIRLRLAEEALAADKHEVTEERLDATERSVRSSLSCAPNDAFLWMILAWLDGVRHGDQKEQMAYLRLSYNLGPNEGWIAVVRNRLALSMYGRLPPDLADAAVKEFDRIVNSWLYWDSISILTGPGWPIHERLLASLTNVGIRQREALAKELYAEGRDVVIPGITPRERRPWY
jgi:hypothetical protein